MKFTLITKMNFKLIFIFYFFTLTNEENPLDTLPLGGYHCYLRCLAKEIHDKTNPDLSKANDVCKQFNRHDFCDINGAACRKECTGLPPLSIESKSTLKPPGRVRAEYGTTAEPNPHIINVQWEQAPAADLYVVQYSEKQTESSGASKPLFTYLETMEPKIQLQSNASSPCSSYSFRVAAITQNAISVFSNKSILDKPTPMPQSNLTYKLTGLIHKDEPYQMVSLVNPEQNDSFTVEATVEFSLPAHWTPGDFTSVGDYVHVLKCDRHLGAYALPPRVLSTVKPEITISLPENAVEAGCIYVYSLVKLVTKCGTKVDFPAPSNQVDANELGLLIKPTKQPSCGVKSFDYEVVSESKNTASVAVTWGDLLAPRSWPVQYYVIRYSLSEKSIDTVFFVPPIKKNLGVVKTCAISNSTCHGISKSVTIPDLQQGQFFVAQICAVYDQSLEKDIQWEILARYPIDLTFAKPENRTAVSSKNITISSASPWQSSTSTQSPQISAAKSVIFSGKNFMISHVYFCFFFFCFSLIIS